MKKPRHLDLRDCRGAWFPDEWHTLLWDRDKWMEPMTGKAAETVIGPIIETRLEIKP